MTRPAWVNDMRGASLASSLLVVLLLVSCGGGEGGDTSPPTLSPTRTPTATLPGSELPSPTGSPDRTEGTGLPSPTDSPDPSETAEEPTAQPSAEPSAQEPETPTPTPTEPETTEAGETPAEPVPEPAEDEGVPQWVWWVAAALVLGAAVAIPLAMRARRRSAWRQKLLEEERELAWFARELLPGLRQAGSIEMAAGGWAVGQARVAAAEDGLTVLESTAPDEGGRERARSLRDALRQARGRMERLTAAEPSDVWVLDLDEIIADLEAALRTSPVSSAEQV